MARRQRSATGSAASRRGAVIALASLSWIVRSPAADLNEVLSVREFQTVSLILPRTVSRRAFAGSSSVDVRQVSSLGGSDEL